MKDPTSFKISTQFPGYFFPSIKKEPLVGFVSPRNIFIVVDLPALFPKSRGTYL